MSGEYEFYVLVVIAFFSGFFVNFCYGKEGKK